MTLTAIQYVEQTPQGGWRISGTRVSLDSVIHAYLAGHTPQAIVNDFPTLMLEQVHGAIAFYLRNRQELDEYLKEQQARWEQLQKHSEAQNKSLLDRLRTEAAK
jgi:uncharacterized protein (DUF433 family)